MNVVALYLCVVFCIFCVAKHTHVAYMGMYIYTYMYIKMYFIIYNVINAVIILRIKKNNLAYMH